MMWIVLALGALALGATGSLLVSSARRVGLALGLGAILAASVFCVLGGGSALTQSTGATSTFDWPLPLGTVRLAVDGLSAWFLILLGIVNGAVAVYSWGYFGGGKGHNANRAYAPLLCTMTAAMVLVFSAADVIVFLVGWEIMSLSALFLVGLHDEDPQARHGAWMYLVATHLGTALGVLPVVGAFVARTGVTRMSEFTGAFHASETGTCAMLFILGVAGFGTKAGFMPFHVWLPVAHPVAPSPVSALMSGVVIKSGIYGLLRLLSWLPELPLACGVGLALLSISTAIMGILYALEQRKLKCMLAYSSVENMGIIGLSIAVAVLGRSMRQPMLVTLGLGGALLHVLNHSLFKGLLFLSAGTVLHTSGTGDIERLGGLSRMGRANALVFLIGAVAICALPPLNGFMSEYVIYLGLLQGMRSLPMALAGFLAACAALLALVGAIALAAFAKVFSVVFLGEPRDPNVSGHATPRSMSAATLFLAVACMAVVASAGVLPQPLSAALNSVSIGAPIPASEISLPLFLPLCAFAVIVFGLLGLRRWMTFGRPASGLSKTWGCGYAFPASSMQYTGSSFSWKLIRSFRHVVRPRGGMPVIVDCFPGRRVLATETPDFVLERVFRPGFTGLKRLFERLWPLQHGRVQLYLVYIVVTVLVAFLVEAWQTPFAVSTGTQGLLSSQSESLPFVEIAPGHRSSMRP